MNQQSELDKMSTQQSELDFKDRPSKKDKKKKKHKKKHHRESSNQLDQDIIDLDKANDGQLLEEDKRESGGKHKKDKKDKKKHKKEKKKHKKHKRESGSKEGDKSSEEEFMNDEQFAMNLALSEAGGSTKRPVDLAKFQAQIMSTHAAEEARKKALAAMAGKKRKGKKMGEDEGDSKDDETYRPGGGGQKKRVKQTKADKDQSKNEAGDDDSKKSSNKGKKVVEKVSEDSQSTKKEKIKEPVETQEPKKINCLSAFTGQGFGGKAPTEKPQTNSGGLGAAVVSTSDKPPAEKKDKDKKNSKDTEMADPKKPPYDVHFLNQIIPQNCGVKKRLIKIYQSSGKARKWINRWVLHPDSTSCPNTQEKDVWIKKWVNDGAIDPLIEMNSDGLTKQDLQTLKYLEQIDESDYANGFYESKYLEYHLAQSYKCSGEGCDKIFFDLKVFKRHMQLKHGVSDKPQQEESKATNSSSSAVGSTFNNSHSNYGSSTSSYNFNSSYGATYTPATYGTGSSSYNNIGGSYLMGNGLGSAQSNYSKIINKPNQVVVI